MTNDFGSYLRERRRSAQVSQRQLADAVGVDFSYISKLENGRLPPPAADTIVRLARAIDCPTEELLAVAKKMPSSLDASLTGEPAALRFLQEASTLRLSQDEWERMIGSLRSLRPDSD
jgi:transcriptional regulator with XRE-family HTH domain